MDHFAGLDLSVKETSVCIVDDTSKIVREVKVRSEPQALLKVLTNRYRSYSRTCLIRSVLVSSIVWRGRAATPPASCSSNTA
jgi:hypothetical protein